MTRQRKKVVWFDRGAKALARVGVPEVSDGSQYVCPLCLDPFAREKMNQLTLEDVPPRSLGGRPLVLTCRRCNSRSGSELDAHAAHLEEAERFMLGKAGGFSPRTRLSIAGITVNVSTHLGGGIVVLGDKARNSPENHRRFQEALTQAASIRPSPAFRLSYKLPKPANFFRASLSRLRSAYLVAFALFGFRFIARDVFSPIREQLEQPEREVLTHTGIVTDTTRDIESMIFIIREPSWLRSLAVKNGRRIVFLPLFDDDVELYSNLRAHLGDGTRPIQFTSNWQIPWPTEPEHLFDVVTAEQEQGLLDAFRRATLSQDSTT